MPRNWVHILSDIDTEKQTAICANCGPVKIKLKNGRYICYLRYSEEKRRWNYRRKYGVIDKAPETCEVCGLPSFQMCYDHDHKTGKFRGWLCSHCNCAIGYARDNPEILRKLADYLEKQKLPAN